MHPPVPVPSDVYEPTFTITGGTANAVVTFGAAYLIGSGVKWYPITPTVTVDALGNGSVTCTASAFYPAGAATVGSTYNWSTPLPTGLPATAKCSASPLSTSGAFARQLAQLMGPATQAVDGTRIAEDYRTLAKALADQDASLDTLVGDMFPDKATDLIGKWEEFLGLVLNPSATLSDRQANCLAKWRAVFGGQPKVMQAALQTLDPSASIAEWTTTQIAAASSNPAYTTVMQRRVFLFSIVLSAATVTAINALGPNVLQHPILQLAQQMKPSYSMFADWSAAQGSDLAVGFGTKGPFLCDNAASLTDQTLLAH